MIERDWSLYFMREEAMSEGQGYEGNKAIPKEEMDERLRKVGGLEALGFGNQPLPPPTGRLEADAQKMARGTNMSNAVSRQKERDAFRAGARFGWEIGGEAWDGMRVEWQANHRYPDGDTNQDDNAQEAQDAKGAPTVKDLDNILGQTLKNVKGKPEPKEAKRCRNCGKIIEPFARGV